MTTASSPTPLRIGCIALVGLACWAVSRAQGWSAWWSGPGREFDLARCIVLDDSGNVLVTGRSEDTITGRNDYATVKYSPDGAELWAVLYDHVQLNDEPHAMAADAAGNVYVTGESQVYFPSLYRADYATVKYSPEGEELWVARYDAAHQNDEAYALALDGRGHVYVTGTSNGDILGDGTDSTGYDIATVKYDTAGNELWVARAGMQGTERGKALGVDPWGNVIVTGSASLPSDYAIGLTLKYDSLGIELWRAIYDYLYPVDLVVDSVGCSYVLGSYAGVRTDFCTVKYDAQGRECWARVYNGPGNLWDDPQDMAVDSLANIYVTGWSVGLDTSDDFCTIKYDSAGNEKWVARYDSGGQTDWPSGVASNGDNVYVVGRSAGEFCVLRYNSAGELQWRAGSDSGGGDARAVTVDAGGNAYVTGTCERGATGLDFLTVKYPPSGVAVKEGPSITLWDAGRWLSRTVFRVPDMARLDCRVIDVQGRDVTDRRERLAPGVYFLKDEGGRLKDEQGRLSAVRKVIVQH